MKREKLIEQIDVEIDWEDFTSIEDVQKDIDRLTEIGATHIALEYDDYRAYCFVYLERDETDKEREDRLKSHELDFIVEQAEREELKRLKAKYE